MWSQFGFCWRKNLKDIPLLAWNFCFFFHSLSIEFGFVQWRIYLCWCDDSQWMKNWNLSADEKVTNVWHVFYWVYTNFQIYGRHHWIEIKKLDFFTFSMIQKFNPFNASKILEPNVQTMVFKVAVTVIDTKANGLMQSIDINLIPFIQLLFNKLNYL